MLLAARLSRLGVCMVGALNSFSPARASMFGLCTKRFWVFNICFILPEVISNYQEDIFVRIDTEEIAQEDKEKQ